MLPSMRYETKKLAQLHHMRKTFQDHKRSIDKIRTKPLQSSLERSKDLNQLRNRMHSAFNYTQFVRGKQINKDNLMLYKKCVDDRKSNISLRVNQKRPDQQFYYLTARKQKSLSKHENNPESEIKNQGYLLKNHRTSPINKMTNFERSRQNLRLAIKISKPCPAINTKKLQEIHLQAKKYKQRIMRYDSISLKSTKYLDKKLSSNSFRSHRIQSTIKSNKSSIQKKLPQSPLASPKNIQPHKKLNRTSIFRNKYNDHQYGFNLTEYQP